MLNLPEVVCRCAAEPRDAGAACGALPSVHAANAATTEGTVARASIPHEPGSICLSRLALLAPHVASELLDLWSTPHLAGRLIEALLGGGHELNLETEVVIELVRLYQHLEEARAAGAPLDHRSGS